MQNDFKENAMDTNRGKTK